MMSTKTRKTLPKSGRNWNDLDAQMSIMAQRDVDWRHGRVARFIYEANEEVSKIGQQAYVKFFTENALGAGSAFLSVKQMHDEVVEMALSLFRAPESACGYLIPSGTESIFMAIKACRDRARSQRKNLKKPNIVIPYSCHPAVNKAGDLMDLEVRRTPLTSDSGADLEAIEAAIDSQTIMLVGSAPSYPHGVIDDIAGLGKIAWERDLWLHVDACVGGYFIPFAQEAGYPIPDFDFSVTGVTSISADLHKHDYCPKQASSLFFRDSDSARYVKFVYDQTLWQCGAFETPTLSGTRSAGAIAGAWAVMNYLGMDGYKAIVDRVMKTTQVFAEGITAMPELTLCGKPDMSVFAYRSDVIDIYAVAEKLHERGWEVGLNRDPAAIHLTLSLMHEEVAQDYLEDLRQAVKTVKDANLKATNVTSTYAV